MQIINLEEKLQKELANFDKTKPYRFFFIDYGQPSKMSCKLVPSENDTIFINIVHEQRKKTTHKKSGNIDITYTVWADDTADMEEDQAFYSIRQNGQLFEVVELTPDDQVFGRYDLDTENDNTLVNAYTDYDEAVSDLMSRVKTEYQNLATLTNDDLVELVDDDQQTL